MVGRQADYRQTTDQISTITTMAPWFDNYHLRCELVMPEAGSAKGPARGWEEFPISTANHSHLSIVQSQDMLDIIGWSGQLECLIQPLPSVFTKRLGPARVWAQIRKGQIEPKSLVRHVILQSGKVMHLATVHRSQHVPHLPTVDRI